MSTPAWIAEVIATVPALASIDETGKVLRKSKQTVRRLVRTGRLHGVRAVESGSSPVLIPRASIESYLRSLVVE
ncbi:MAG TPA: helix-turn-helix domain-containing protein [Polyangiaceae bacterium]|nr:helix-turn-helix domain-containing protein [Polyangiaceae bacterium]